MTDDTLKAIRRASRELFKQMPRGGRQGSKKGKRGYSRKIKHSKRNNP